MPLPIVNEVPRYTLTVPSTKKEFRYRPFLVKEQKVLLIALESQDNKQILSSIVDTISSCIDEDIDLSSLTTFDVEYMFTRIRAKSVGETSKIIVKCSECEADNEHEVQLDQITVDVPDKIQNIQLNDKYTLKLKYPMYSHMTKADLSENASSSETLYHLTIGCLDSLQSEEENFSFKDETKKDTEDFLDSLTSDQFNMIMEFVNTVPSLSHDIKFTCTSCNQDNTYTLRGINDFFS
jgi:hypothetical protein